jgi:lupus La protein
MQVDLEAYFRGFGAVEMVRLRRTATGLFKGSVLVQFSSKDEADKYIAEPREYEGNLLETKSKQEWVKSKIEENESLDPAEQRERSARKLAELKIKKPFSAFKEMERLELHDKKRDVKRGRDNRRGGGKQGRRGYREDAPRDRSRSPVVRDDTPIKQDAAGPQKRSLEEAEEGKPVKREKVENGD